jgi:hypothetical protein
MTCVCFLTTSIAYRWKLRRQHIIDDVEFELFNSSKMLAAERADCYRLKQNQLREPNRLVEEASSQISPGNWTPGA